MLPFTRLIAIINRNSELVLQLINESVQNELPYLFLSCDVRTPKQDNGKDDDETETGCPEHLQPPRSLPDSKIKMAESSGRIKGFTLERSASPWR